MLLALRTDLGMEPGKDFLCHTAEAVAVPLWQYKGYHVGVCRLICLNILPSLSLLSASNKRILLITSLILLLFYLQMAKQFVMFFPHRSGTMQR